VNLASRDLLGSSSELPLGFALRIIIQPEVCPHHRAFAFWSGGACSVGRRSWI